jgi:predicted phage tail protein
MTNVIIHGRLGEIVGKHHKFACSKLSEVFRAIESNTGMLRKYTSLNRRRKMSIFVNGKMASDKNFDLVNVKNSEVVILPILMGAIGITIMTIIAQGAALTIKAKITAVIINIAFAIGMSLLMSKLLAPDDPDTASTSSYIFNQAENAAKQGSPVPVGYGRFKVGSTVLSVSLINVDKTLTLEGNFYGDLFSSENSNQNLDKQEIDITSSSIAKFN